MKKLVLLLVSIGCLFLGSSLIYAQAATPNIKEPAGNVKQEEPAKVERKTEVPAAFVLLDRTGAVNTSIYNDWRQQVRQGYRWPYYELKDDMPLINTAEEVLAAEGKSTSKLDVATFKKIAEKTGVDVVALMIINCMDMQIIYLDFRWDSEQYARVVADADLYVYKKDGDKLLKKLVRYYDTSVLATADPPERIIKYAMRKLVNQMENRPQI